jgi:hypothetical protein
VFNLIRIRIHVLKIVCFSYTGCHLDKYSQENRFGLQKFTDAKKALGSDIEPNLYRGYFGIVNSAVAKSTWSKYSSALNTFACFEADSRKVFPWPLPLSACRSFIVWGSSVRKLSHSTLKSYLSAIKFMHTLRGFNCDYISKDATISLLMKGVSKIALSLPTTNIRRVVTIPLLITIGSKIARAPWDSLTKHFLALSGSEKFWLLAKLNTP